MFEGRSATSAGPTSIAMAVNLTGAWLLCRAAQPYLADTGRGRVINVSSTFGLVGVSDRAAYATSKGFLFAERSLAMEWASMGINVNGVAPGPFLTDMNIPFQHSEHAMRVLNHEVAMRRWGKLHEIQGPVCSSPRMPRAT
jgi:NAD(P)-dependent dehydrogenase (short-subunit alcohol dehydrogenase family)